MSDNQSVSREECEAVLARCLITKNMCGTDTWKVGSPCPCWRCQNFLKVNIHTLAQAHIALLAENANLKRDKERLYWLLAELNEMYSDSAVDVMGWPHEGPITIEDIDAALQGKSAALDSGEEQ